jgi:PAS domain S-box-containing protein
MAKDKAAAAAFGAQMSLPPARLIRSVNHSTEQVFGFSERELTGQNVSVLMPEPFRSRHDGYIRHYLETGERKIIGVGRRVMALRKSGAIFPAHLAVSAFEINGQRYFTGIVHDLSGQSAAHLREQPLLQAIFNQLPDAVLIVDPSGAIRLCNLAVARIFGYAPEALIGQPVSLLCADQRELQRIDSAMARLARGGSRETMSIGFRHKSGKPLPSGKGSSPRSQARSAARSAMSRVQRAARRDPALAFRLCELTSRELAAAQDLLLTTGLRTACERVAAFLPAISRHSQLRGVNPDLLELPMTRADIGDMLSLTLETVSRCLSLLRQLGVIDLEQSSRVRIVDKENLERLAITATEL